MEHKKMLYPYAILANDLTVTYTQVIKDSNNNYFTLSNRLIMVLKRLDIHCLDL